MVYDALNTIMTLRVVVFAVATVNLSLALRCFDSTVHEPHHTVQCAKGQSCYDEYYAYNSSKGEIHQHFDRFCVFQAHCTQRGIDNACMNLEELDQVVQQTFSDKIRKSHLIKPTQILYSRFCCCDEDGCNSFSALDSLARFNVTSSAAPLNPTTGHSSL